MKKIFSRTLFIVLALLMGTVADAQNDRPVYDVVEQAPQYPGGTAACVAFIQKNLGYPESCRLNRIQGKVLVSFVIDEDGSISEIKTVQSPHKDLSAEAERVVRAMPKWQPGKQRGQAVRCRYNLPVTFRLTGEETADKMTTPKFPGGDAACIAFIANNLKYPKSCSKSGIEGTVVVNFVVNADGKLTDITVVESPHKDLAKEAVRVVKAMPKWQPGTENGKPVNCKFKLPVTFRLGK